MRLLGWCGSAFVLLFTGLVQANLQLDDIPTHAIDLNGHTHYQLTDSAQYRAHSLPTLNQDFKALPRLGHIGLTHQSVWLTLSINNNTQQRVWYVEVGDADLQFVNLHQQIDNGAWQHWSAGASVSQQHRAFKQASNVFTLTLPANSHSRLVIEVRSASSINVPLSLWTSESYLQFETQQAMQQGLVYGVLLLMCILCVMVNPYVGWPVQLSYCFSLLGFMLFSLANNGVLLNIFTSMDGHWLLRIKVLALQIGSLFFLTFSRELLQLKQVHVWLDRAVLIFIALSAASLVMGQLVDISTLVMWARIMVPVAGVVVVAMGLAGFSHHKWIAFFYLLANVPFWILATNVYAEGYSDQFGSDDLTIAAALRSGIFLLLFVGIYLNRRHQAEALSLLDVQKNKVIELEQQVRQRTHELLREKESAELANQKKSDFLARMNHEIRTPLATVLGIGQLLAQEKMSTRATKWLATLATAGSQLRNQIDDVLDLTRIEHGQFEVNNEPMMVEEEIRSVIGFLQQGAIAKGLILQADLNLPSQPMLGDSVRLRQLITNLVANAIKYTDHGRITVSAHVSHKPKRGARLNVAVQDSGKQKNQVVLDELFMAYQRAPNESIRGFGLGLSICKQVVSELRGDIGATSNNIGNKFWFSLPYQEAASQTMPQETQFGEPWGVAPLTMLVVEDNKINLEITQLLLSKQGHMVTAVDNGAAAVALVSRQDFDLVLMDIRMKNINGLVATRQIRSLSDPVKSAVEIFALTGDVTAASIASCMEAGMDAVLSKPLRLSDLHHCLSGQWQPVDTKAIAPPLRVDPTVRNQLSTHLSNEKLTELFRRQLASLDITMKELETAWLTQNVATIVAVAHQISGAASMAGYGALAAAAKRLDQPDGLDLVLAKSHVEFLRREWTATRYLAQQMVENPIETVAPVAH
ncbi:MAG TPA: hypothetical protein DE045_01650 [Oceanospirillaceae bacterium]|nr:hypothetical protein [Oceanospirillaceae bacterium]